MNSENSSKTDKGTIKQIEKDLAYFWENYQVRPSNGAMSYKAAVELRDIELNTLGKSNISIDELTPGEVVGFSWNEKEQKYNFRTIFPEEYEEGEIGGKEK